MTGNFADLPCRFAVLYTGIPSQAEYVKQYCQHTRRAFPIPKWHFYVAFSAFRLAGIAQGVYKRYAGYRLPPHVVGAPDRVRAHVQDSCKATHRLPPPASTERCRRCSPRPLGASWKRKRASPVRRSSFGGVVVRPNAGGGSAGEASAKLGSPKKGVSTMEDIMAALPDPRWEPVSDRSVALQKQLWRFLVDNVFLIERQVHDEVNQPGNRWKVRD